MENDHGYDVVVPPAEPRQNQPRDNNREGNNGRDEFDRHAQQRDNIDGNNRRDDQVEPRENQQRGNNGEGSNDRNRIAMDTNFNNRQGVNLDIVDIRKRDYLGGQRPAAGNEDMSFPQGLPMRQETFNGAMENLNIPGNQHRENCNERDSEVTYENEVAHENDNQQSEEAYEDMNAPQAPATSQQSFESTTARHPTENDDDVSGTYTNLVQCTDDIKYNPHKQLLG